MKDIFEFNHIDKSLSESDIATIKNFYKHYHKKYWCYKKSYKKYKLLDEAFTLTGVGLVVIGTIAGGITLNPVILGVINGSGVIVTSIAKLRTIKERLNCYKLQLRLMRKFWLNYDQLSEETLGTKMSLSNE